MPELIPPARPLVAATSDMSDWDTQTQWYPPTGPPGLSYFPGRTPAGTIDCLLWRNEAGELVGILNHYPFRTPEGQEPGTFNVWVKPGWQRRGIASRLGDEAFRRWDIDIALQKYTPAGVALAEHWLARHQSDVGTGTDAGDTVQSDESALPG
jgi:GNAT superfamily N-acetyltransferase